jgi:cobalamin 5'-phosphate synthase/cobalamin synthase
MVMGVKKMLASLTVAWLFLTRIPLPGWWSGWAGAQQVAFYQTVPFFPLVGLALGGLLWLADLGVSQVFSPLLSSLILVVLLVVMTGGLHLDGWMDTADGLLSGRDRQRMLEIMKDSRVGGLGALALVCLLLLKWGGLAELTEGRGPLLLIMPVAGRVAMMGCILFWPDARQGGGLGSLFHQANVKSERERRRWRFSVWCSMLVISLLVTACCGGRGLLVMWLAVLIGWAWARRVARRLGGLTGDVFGAVNELVEVVVVYTYLAARLLLSI